MSLKDFNLASDVAIQKSVMNEVFDLTGTFFSGAAAYYIQKYQNVQSGSALSGGFWETVFDGSPTSLSSSGLVDMTYGHSNLAYQVGRAETFMNSSKQRVYRNMAKLLLGSEDNYFTFDNVQHHNVVFFMLKRRIMKDEIKKGDFVLTLQRGGATSGANFGLADTGGASSFDLGSAGDEASLYSGSLEVGRLYYNVGIAAFHTGVFDKTCEWEATTTYNNLDEVAISGNIDRFVDGFRNRVANSRFTNQTNLNSTIYFCRALNNEFNYSSNQSFIDGDNRIIPTSGTDNQTRTYITKVGLLNAQNELLAVASLSQPVKKSPDSEVSIRCRLIY